MIPRLIIRRGEGHKMIVSKLGPFLRPSAPLGYLDPPLTMHIHTSIILKI